ncbi:hypothetical protein DAI22_10g195400 [Oryza sativa Japonica Group]|nr:hypothetical protein DAI22_10g195400 [Oryza sativa Japonica Group]
MPRNKEENQTSRPRRSKYQSSLGQEQGGPIHATRVTNGSSKQPAGMSCLRERDQPKLCNINANEEQGDGG